MKNVLAILLFSASSLAFAHNCPNEMKAIDAKLGSATSVSAENITKIKACVLKAKNFIKKVSTMSR